MARVDRIQYFGWLLSFEFNHLKISIVIYIFLLLDQVLAGGGQWTNCSQGSADASGSGLGCCLE